MKGSKPNYRPGIIFVGMETSGVLRRACQALGHETYSCDLLPSQDGGEQEVYSADGHTLGRHMTGDVFQTLVHLAATRRTPDAAVFHPDCTYLTGSAAWAFADPDYERWPGVGYHQAVLPGTLVGESRRQARRDAVLGVHRIANLRIATKIIENPVGALSTFWRKPSHIIQPYDYGDDASKKTCLWVMGMYGEEVSLLLPIDPAQRIAGRIVNGVERWANQTDSGQNRLPPRPNRWQARSDTFPGIAAMLAQVLSYRLTGAYE